MKKIIIKVDDKEDLLMTGELSMNLPNGSINGNYNLIISNY